MLTQTFEKRDPRKLKPHPLHLKLYPTRKPSQQMLDEIADIGIQQPPIILPDDTIISGHCRTQAAIAAKLPEIRVIVRHDLQDSPLETQQLVISLNATQVNRDNATRCREAAHLADIIKQINTQRQKLFLKQFKTDYQKLNQNDQENAHEQRMEQCDGTVSPAETRSGDGQETTPEIEPDHRGAQNAPHGKTRQIVAETLGISTRQAEQQIAVGRAIRKAEDEGDNNAATNIATAANQSITKTAKKISPNARCLRRSPNQHSQPTITQNSSHSSSENYKPSNQQLSPHMHNNNEYNISSTPGLTRK